MDATSIIALAVILAVAASSYLLGRRRGEELAMARYATLIDRCLFLLDQVAEDKKKDRAYRDHYGNLIDAGRRRWN